MEMNALQLGFEYVTEGTITSPRGFRANGVYAGFRRNPQRRDLALIEADEVCTAAGVFTQNVFCAAPVQLCRQRLGEGGYGTARAVLINSGCANAATGPQGLENAEETARIAAEAIGCSEDDVLVASTGVIGTQLALDPFRTHVPILHQTATDDAQGGHAAAHAILTTDTIPKECAVRYTSKAPGYEGSVITVGGMVKGSGMIMPNMATMIAVITTDAAIAGPAAKEALLAAVQQSFNKVTVDSDTSTNDTCIMLASGAAVAAGESIQQGSEAFHEFSAALSAVCNDLARKIAVDGEGASRLVTVKVTGAATDADADMAARAIANSPLVKTAICGRDANWGRIAAAVGKSGAKFRQEDTDIDIMGLPVLRGGLPIEFSEEEALRRFERPEITIDVDLGAGDCSTCIWTCDFTHEYITINGDYRT